MDNSVENKVSVLLLTYRKIDSLKEILEVISKYAPKKLYISANNYKSIKDYFDVKRVKKLIKNTTLPFETEFVFHKKHLHINDVIPKTIDYVFTKEEYLIILEDDVVPSLSFFTFCEQLLKKYENDPGVGCINGCNLNAVEEHDSCFFSNISVPYWGWATWKSRWKKYRGDNFYLNNHKENISRMISNDENRSFFMSCFEGNSSDINVWDLQWNLSLMANNLATIIPGVNLITNKGFTKKGTSIKYTQSEFSSLKKNEINVNHISIKKNEISVAKYEQLIIQLFKEISNNIGNNKNFLSM